MSTYKKYTSMLYRSNKLLIFLSAILILLVSLLFLLWLKSNEYYYLGWDPRVYFGATQELFIASEKSFSDMIQILEKRSSSTHNSYFAVPLLLVLKFIGFSQHKYLLALATVYLIPAIIAFMLLSRSIIHPSESNNRFSFYYSSLLVYLSLTPPWGVLSIYKPDFGGLIFLIGITYVFTSDVFLKKASSIAALCAFSFLALLFRRHLAYSILAIYAAGSAYSFMQLLCKEQDKSSFIVHHFKLLFVGCLSLAILYYLVPGYARQFLINDYSLSYSAYTTSYSDTIIRWLEFYGGIPIVFAAIGYYFSISRKVISKSVAVIFIVSPIVWSLLWITSVRYYGLHYSINPILISVAVGDFLFIYVLLTSRIQIKLKVAISLCASLILIYPLLQGVLLNKVLIPNAWIGYQVRPIALHRDDWSSYSELVKYIYKHAGKSNSVYIASSSTSFNNAVIKSAAENNNYKSLDILQRIPQVDKRDYQRLGSFMEADYVVTANPVQYHLSKEEQLIVSSIVNLLLQDSSYSKYYEELPRTFAFKGNGKFMVSVFKRIMPIPLDIKAVVIKDIFDKLNLISQLKSTIFDLNVYNGSSLGRSNNKLWLYTGSDRKWPATYLYIGQEGEKEISGLIKFGEACGDVQLKLSRQYGEKVVAENSFNADNNKFQHFYIQGYMSDSMLIEIMVSKNSRGKCGVLVKDLEIKDRKAVDS